jgi:hypothetical protein
MLHEYVQLWVWRYEIKDEEVVSKSRWGMRRLTSELRPIAGYPFRAGSAIQRLSDVNF